MSGGGESERGIVFLVMVWDENMQCFDCSKVFWPELFEFQEKNLKGYTLEKLSISKQFELLATNKPI